MKIFKKSLATLSMILLLGVMVFMHAPYEVSAIGEEIITAADVTVVIPVANANPDFNPISGDASKYTVENVHWYLYESPEYPSLDASSNFVAGKDYALRLVFTANPGYEFAEDAVFTVNGETTSCYGASANREFIFYEIADATAEYTITFKDGGTILGTDTVNGGGKATRPATNPTKSGFAFVNWYADAGLNNLFDFEGTTINADTIIYARYNELITAISATVTEPVAGEHPSFTVTPGNSTAYSAIVYAWYDLDNNGASMSASDTFVADNEYQVRIHFTANEGYQFADSMEYSINDTPNNTAYETAYQRGMDFVAAAATVTQHTITFKDGESTIGTDTVNDGGKATRPATNPTKSGWAFVNWYADAGLNNLFDFEGTTITADTTIYAKWRDHSSIAVGTTTGGKWSSNELNAENMTESMNGTLPVNGSVTLIAVPDFGYRFVGWYEGIIGSSYFVENHNSTLISSNSTYTTTVADTLVIRAVFEPETAQSIYVYYSAGEGTGGTFYVGLTNAGSSYDVRTFESFTSMSAPSGKHFAGWNISDGGQITAAQLEVNPSFVPETIGESLTRSLTFTAYYEDDVATTYKVSFDRNGGTGTMDEVTGLTGTYTLPANGFTAPENKQFKGWSLTSDGAIIATVEMTENRTVYAIWEDIPAATYTILEGANQTYTKGSNGTITIKASGDLDKVIAIEIDNGNVIDPSNYELASGSTILTLKTSFLENSSLGEHTITIKYDDGEVETKLTIAEATGDDNNQTTGDNGQGTGDNNQETGNDNTNTNNSNNPETGDNIFTYIYSLIISIICLASGSIYLKKRILIESK